jgi:FlaA1/EpsC-like NDP-sugar epimerase
MFDAILQLSRFKKRLISLCVDSIALISALWASFALRLDESSWEPDRSQLVIALLTVVFTLVVFVRLGLYRAVIRYMSDKAFITIITGVAVSALLLIVLSYSLNAFVPRSVPVIYAALALIFVGGSRMSMRMLVQYSSGQNKERVAIVGAGKTAVQLAKALQQGDEYHPVLFISLVPANHKTLVVGLPAFSLNHLEQAISSYGVVRLLLAVDADLDVNRRQLLTQLEKLELPVQTVPSFSEVIAGQARINDIRDLEIEDLLGRDPVGPNNAQLSSSLFDRSVMVTGAGGSIGSELCRQIIRHRPKCLVLFEQSEFALYAIERELQKINGAEALNVCVHPLLGNVVHRRRCEAVMRSFSVQTVYHAAAYKHVPLVELNVIEGVQNNVLGTLHAAEAAIAAGVERFVLISTDKAVRPTNVMGASKRMAELVLQGLAQRQTDTVFSMVRFGNVLGSSGSVVPLFRDQINNGGPVTVTHPDIIRYFMTIPEAGQLVLQAGSMGQGGDVFVLDMGEPVKIADLARKMIHLMGRRERTAEQPDGEIELIFTGLRPGEKLFEELLIGDNPQGTTHPRIMMAREACMPWLEVANTIKKLQYASQTFDCESVVAVLKMAPTGFAPNGCVEDLVWNLAAAHPYPRAISRRFN